MYEKEKEGYLENELEKEQLQQSPKGCFAGVFGLVGGIMIMAGIFAVAMFLFLNRSTPPMTSDTNAFAEMATPTELKEAVCLVPDLQGLSRIAAENAVIQLGLQPVIDVQYDESVGANLVISQEPLAKSRLEPCQGDIFISVNLGPTPIPPTPSPMPTSTPLSATPTPVAPLPTPTATRELQLFWDDFDDELEDAWGATGHDFRIYNANLYVNDEGFFETAQIGDDEWDDYSVKLNNVSIDNYPYRYNESRFIQIHMRIVDRDNYMLFECTSQDQECQWAVVVNGQKVIVDNSGFSTDSQLRGNIRMELEGNIYRTFVDGMQVVRFEDSTFAAGGLRLIVNTVFLMDSFEVALLQ